jgi:hypothetical protein
MRYFSLVKGCSGTGYITHAKTYCKIDLSVNDDKIVKAK